MTSMSTNESRSEKWERERKGGVKKAKTNLINKKNKIKTSVKGLIVYVS